MTINIEDATGKPDSDEDIREAIKVINEIMVKQPTVLPMLTVHSGVIKRALEELLNIRASRAKLRQLLQQVVNMM